MTLFLNKFIFQAFQLTLLLLISDSIFGQINLLKDINTSTSISTGSNPSHFCKLGTQLFFSAETETQGIELWKTDGTSIGTHLLKNIAPNFSSEPKNLIEYNGIILFEASQDYEDGGFFKGLWKSDGTIAGTQLLMAIPGSFSCENFTLYNGLMYFTSYSETNNSLNLWKTDGTTNGTVLVSSPYSNSTGVLITNLIVSNGSLFFLAGSNYSPYNLWKSDGTTAGTIDLSVGIQASSICTVNNILFAVGSNSGGNYELWKTDGTIGGTELVLDILPGSSSSYPQNLISYSGFLFFKANDGVNGEEFWKSDGTPSGTVLVKNINTSVGSGSSLGNFIVYNGLLYFSANNGTNGNELWQTDGSTSGTILLKDIYSGTLNGDPVGFTISNNILYFSAKSSGSGNELWKTNGTNAGTVLIKDIYSGALSSNPTSLYDFNGTLIFNARNTSNNYELWKSDGTNSGTLLLKNIYTDVNSSNCETLFQLNNKIYMAANDGSNPEAIWATDGTTAGTTFITTYGWPNTIFNEDAEAAVNNNKFVYRGGPSTNRELYISNGTTSGSQLLLDLDPSTSGGSNPHSFKKIGNSVFFVAYTPALGQELYKTDGTSAGTVLVKNIGNGNYDGAIDDMIDLNGTLIFSASAFGNSSNTNIWRSDGTTSGTYAISNLTGTINNLNSFFVYNNEVYFEMSNATQNRLYKTNGTLSGTTLVYTFPAIVNGSFTEIIEKYTVHNGILFFTTKASVGGYYLFRTDGTSSGTYGISSSSYSNTVFVDQVGDIVSYQNYIYFVSRDAVHGTELWRSDGTLAGSQQFLDIHPGPFSSYPFDLHVIDGTLFFTANNGADGFEFWRSNGTVSSTYKYAELEGGGISSEPKFIGKLNNKSIYSAYSSSTGRELYSYINTQNTNITACDSYTWPINGLTYTSSGFYSYTVGSASGGDSVLTLNLILNASSSIDTVNACDSLVWIDGNTYYTNNNSASITLTNSSGCDSVVTLNLTINSSSIGYDFIVACDSFTWIDGNTYFTDNNTATFVLSNSNGCDSIITLNLTINSTNFGNEIITACDSFVWIDGNTYYSNNNSAMVILTNSIGCDSVVTLDLSIIPSLPTNITTFSLPSDTSLCNGQIAITTTGNAPFTIDINNGAIIENSNGYKLVDSLCPGYLNLFVTDNCGDTLTQTIVIPIDSNYVFNNPFVDSIAVDSLGSTIQNCTIYYNSIDTAFIESLFMTGNIVNIVWNIIDSTGSNYDTTTFVPNAGNGVYWVQLSVFCPQESNIEGYFTVTQAINIENGTFSSAHLSENLNDRMKIYPNPTQSDFTIESTIQLNSIILFDAAGRKVIEQNVMSNSTNLSLSMFENGIYFLEIQTPFGSILKRIIKQ